MSVKVREGVAFVCFAIVTIALGWPTYLMSYRCVDSIDSEGKFGGQCYYEPNPLWLLPPLIGGIVAIAVRQRLRRSP